MLQTQTCIYPASQAGGVLDPKAQLASADGKGNQAAMNKALELSQLNKGNRNGKGNGRGKKNSQSKSTEDAKAPRTHVAEHPTRICPSCVFAARR